MRQRLQTKTRITALFMLLILSSGAIGQRKIIRYESLGTQNFTPPAGVSEANILVVAGGGGGGCREGGGGGGAGGVVLIENFDFSNISSPISVIIGDGGNGGVLSEGSNGGDSKFDTIIAIGGGGGGYGKININQGLDGGSGGGKGGSKYGNNSPGKTNGQGYNGGNSYNSGTISNRKGGGGGGAGAPGGDAIGTKAGNGGAGKYFGNIFGTDVGVNGWFAGGGGGACNRNGLSGAGGKGGGGDGSNSDAKEGVPGTGAGGGAAGYYSWGWNWNKGAKGGSGAVIIAYATTYYSTRSGDPALASNWNTKPDGTGTSPSNTNNLYQKFVIQNNHTMTTSGVWTLGDYSSIQIQNGGLLIENHPINIGVKSTLRIDDGGKLNHNVNSVNIFGGVECFSKQSTVEYGFNGNQNIIEATYGNLILKNGETNTLQGEVTVANNLVLNSILQLEDFDFVVLNNINSGTTPFGVNNMIITNGNGFLTRGADGSMPLIFPISSDGKYSEAVISNIIPNTGTVSIRTRKNTTLGSNYLPRVWDAKTSINGKTIAVTFKYDATETEKKLEQVFVNSEGMWKIPDGTESYGATDFAVANTTYITNNVTSWTVATKQKTFFSYKSGNWTDEQTWTSDPSGVTYIPLGIPSDNDIAVILLDRIVTLPNNIDTENLEININSGGILDMRTFGFTEDIVSLMGQGKLRLASNNFPNVISNSFVSNTGGTTEYYNTGDFILKTSQNVYNNLVINVQGTATQLNNLTLNGNLYIKSGAFQINDNSIARRELNIAGDVIVDAQGFLTVGTGATNTTSSPSSILGGTFDYYNTQSHKIVINGDFTNNGVVKFTNMPYPVYNKFPPMSGNTAGFATVYFQGSNNNILTCNNTTIFYNLILNKGVDQSSTLTVYSNDYNNFKLYGANNASAYGSGANPNIRKALWIRTGTLVLKGEIVIPSLTEGTDNSGNLSSDFYIPANGALVLDGSQVTVLITADSYKEVNVAYGLSLASNSACGLSGLGVGNHALSLYGKLQVNKGYLSTRESGGVITWTENSGQFIINGGTIDTKQIRSDNSGSGLIAYEQSGGTLILRGRLQHRTLTNSISKLRNTNFNRSRRSSNLDVNQATFSLKNANNVFSMSGGEIQIYDAPSIDGNIFNVESEEKNINVTGGTIYLNPISIGSSDASNHIIKSTAPLGNLIIRRSNTSDTEVHLEAYDLTVLKNLTIKRGRLAANDKDVSIGGNFTITAESEYISGNNTTTFNGAKAQVLSAASNLIKFNNLTIDKPGGSILKIDGSLGTIDVQGNLKIKKGTLNDNGKVINVSKDIYNSGIHEGDGQIVIKGTNSQLVTGDGNGIFQNITLNNSNSDAAPIYLGSNSTINGNLTFSNDKRLNIKTHNLKFGATASIVGISANRFIQTEGSMGDGGITKEYSSTSLAFSFPIGTSSENHIAAYTPATIALSEVPTICGSITVIPIGQEHPNTSVKKQSLTYFWRVKSEGFSLGSATVNHSYVYKSSDVKLDETNYEAARFNRSSLGWSTYNALNISNNIIGGNNSELSNVDFIDGEYTAGYSTSFGQPTIYYSKSNGSWNTAENWSTEGHNGASASNIPGEGDIVIVGGGNLIKLNSVNNVINQGSVNVATLLIEKGATLDIGNNPSSRFEVVASHENGNGIIRVAANYDDGSTFGFPSGDFSDYNKNLGTTELYSTNENDGKTFWLLDNIKSYGNLIISPLGGSNIIFPNNDLLIYGNLTTKGQNSESWFSPSWRGKNYNPKSKTITINGNFHLQGGALVWYNKDNTGYQDFVIGGDLILDSQTGIKVYTKGTGNSQSIAIGGSLINNSLKPISSSNNGYRGADFTNIPLIFTGEGSHYITNDDSNAEVYTKISFLTLDKGIDQSNELTIDISGDLYTSTDNWLTLKNGTLKYMRKNPKRDFTISTWTEFNIPSTAGLYIDYTSSSGKNILIANGNSNSNDLFLNGKLTIVDGNVYVGKIDGTTEKNNDIEYSGGGASSIEIRGGNLMVNGQIRRNTSVETGVLKYNQSGGNVVINGQAAVENRAKFEIGENTGNIFDMSGGTMTIVRGGGTTYGDLYIRAKSSIVTGGEIIFTQTPTTILGIKKANGEQDYILDAKVPLNNLTITGKIAGPSQNAKVTVLTSKLTLNGNLLISNGYSILDMNAAENIDLTVKGGFKNNGEYNHYKNLTTFNGVSQTIEGATNTNFYNLWVTPITSLSLIRDITVLNDLEIKSGNLLNESYRVNVKGDLVNNAVYSGNKTQGGIILNGKTLQYISGNGRFGRLEIKNKYGAKIKNEITLESNLKLSEGVLDINKYLLSLSENCNIEGSGFNKNKMITTNGDLSDEGVQKYISSHSGANEVFTFPIGSRGKYTPVTLTYSENAKKGFIQAKGINGAIASAFDKNNVLQYYWYILSEGLNDFSGKLEFSYLQDDVKLLGGYTEADYISACSNLFMGTWHKYNSEDVDEDQNAITFTYEGVNTIWGEYTAGVSEALPDEVHEFISKNNGNWSDPDTWQCLTDVNYILTGAPNGFIVTIREEHTVVLDEDNAKPYRTTINGTLKVDPTTFNHNLGEVRGNGILYLENGKMPAGRYNYFFDCSSNSILEYGGNGDYTILSDLYNKVPRLYFTGTGVRKLPSFDLIICKRLLIDGPTLENQSNKKLTIQGKFERLEGTFHSGTGDAIVSFEGYAEQFVGGELGNFTGENAFNNLEIKNSDGLTINNTGDIEVKGKLLLTSGNINTSALAKLTISNATNNCIIPDGGSENSFVNGPLIKSLNVGFDFNFPIGKEGELGNELTLIDNQTKTKWTAEYFSPNDTYKSYESPLTYVNSNDRWSVSAEVKAFAKISINWNEESDLTPANTQNNINNMRVANYRSDRWYEVESNAKGNNSFGSVSSATYKQISVGQPSLFTTACVKQTKPRAKFMLKGVSCGTSGIPVSFSAKTDLNYILGYTLDDVVQDDVTVDKLPFVLETPKTGEYKLVKFIYAGDEEGIVDTTTIINYEQPIKPNAGSDIFLCGQTYVNLSGSEPNIGSVSWSILSGKGGEIKDKNNKFTRFDGRNSTSYQLKYTADNNSCKSYDTVKVVFSVTAKQPSEFIAFKDQVCQNDEAVKYSVFMDSTVNYSWGFSKDNDWTTNEGLVINGSKNIITADYTNVSEESGTLRVIASNACGDSDPREIDVTINPSPEVKLTDDKGGLLCRGDGIKVTVSQITALNISEYKFFLDGVNTVSSTSATYNIPSLSDNAEVIVIATTDKNCANTDTTTIYVADRIWSGGISSKWGVSGNWGCGEVPTSEDDVIIPNSPTRMPVVFAEAECKGLRTMESVTITLEDSNILNIYDNWYNKGAIIPNQGTVKFAGNTTIESSTNLSLHNLEVNNSSTLISSSKRINLTGDFINRGIFNHNEGTIAFTGNKLQHLNGDFRASKSLNNVVVENGEGVVLENGEKKIDGYLELIDGLLTSNKLLTLGPKASTNISKESGKVTSYISGILKKEVYGNEAFFFPIGNESVYKPIGITNLEDASGINKWIALYDGNKPTEYDVEEDAEMLRVSNKESWNIKSKKGNAKIILSWDEANNGKFYVDKNNLDKLRVAYLSGGEWLDTKAGFATGEGEAFGTITSGDVIKFNDSKGGFKVFTLGSTSPTIHPLPVELISFTGREDNQEIKLKWITATETNNDYFEVQRSDDATNFYTIGKVIGAGTSANPNNYNFTDRSPINGINYYRLKQVDFNGNYKLYHTIAIHAEGIALLSKHGFSIYPNPFNSGNLTIQLENIEPHSRVTLSVVSIAGDVIYQEDLDVPVNQKLVNLRQINKLAAGIYLVNVKIDTNIMTKRLVVY